MGNAINLQGQRFGRLTVIERDCNDRKGNASWICKCDCGNYSVVKSNKLLGNQAKSCGCSRCCGNSKPHGMSNTRLYMIWGKMKDRCYRTNSPAYSRYGGRGIVICDEWKENFQSFYDWAMDNGYSEDLTIDRIDVNGNYEPSNCRWVTRKVQNNNTRQNHYLTFNNETHTIAEWAEILEIPVGTLYTRINVLGWSDEKALSEPIRQSSRHL